MTTTPTFDRAVVIGGSVAGLATATMLASRSREVVVVERRPLADGTVAPQGHLPHVMLASGQQVLEDLHSGIGRALQARGAHDGGPDPDRVPCRWVAAGTTRRHLRLPDTGIPRALCSRPLVEGTLRERTAALPNVTLLADSVVEVLLTGDRTPTVTGIRLRGRGVVEADLVVDASGRSSRVGDWLAGAGLARPSTEEVLVDLRYTGFVVERRPGDFDGVAFVVVQNTPTVPRIGVALPMERGRWQVVLGGYFGDAAPTDSAGAVAFARGLADASLAELLGRPYLTEPARYTFRSSLRHRWERLPVVPTGLCAVGDAVASFNPIYGQGMSSALLQVEALAATIDRYGADPRLAHAAAKAAAKVVDRPWMVATGADFIYPDTAGRRPPGQATINRYVDRVTRAAATDEVANAALSAVQHLLEPPSSLFAPRVAWRALRPAWVAMDAKAPDSATSVSAR